MYGQNRNIQFSIVLFVEQQNRNILINQADIVEDVNWT